MRARLCVLWLTGLSLLSGCGEFVRTDERTTAIDVVGEPSDNTPNTMEPADILGSALPAPDDSESLTDAESLSNDSAATPDEMEEHDQPADETENNQRGGTPKPPRIRTANQYPGNSR